MYIKYTLTLVKELQNQFPCLVNKMQSKQWFLAKGTAVIICTARCLKHWCTVGY